MPSTATEEEFVGYREPPTTREVVALCLLATGSLLLCGVVGYVVYKFRLWV